MCGDGGGSVPSLEFVSYSRNPCVPKGVQATVLSLLFFQNVLPLSSCPQSPHELALGATCTPVLTPPNRTRTFLPSFPPNMRPLPPPSFSLPAAMLAPCLPGLPQPVPWSCRFINRQSELPGVQRCSCLSSVKILQRIHSLGSNS